MKEVIDYESCGNKEPVPEGAQTEGECGDSEIVNFKSRAPVVMTRSGRVSVLPSKFRKYTPATINVLSSRPLPLTLKHVTKSLSALGPMDELNPFVLFLNSVPKCGSEILVYLLQRLQGWNNFKHVRLKGSARKSLNRVEQEEVVYNITDLTRNYAIPLTFDSQMRFINFSLFDKQSPTFINLIRDPVEQIISRISNNKNGSLETLQTCITEKKLPCIDGNVHDLSITYFCGQDPRCGLLNNHWALKRAQFNVKKYYRVVGVLEELNTTVAVLELQLPYFFKNATTFYFNNLQQNFKEKQQRRINADLQSYLKNALVTEYKFYHWIKNRLYDQLRSGNGANFL
ncbi:hypothetical protein RN001_011650 [Aquatica leii]|uniref:Uronyl 2-sulfotransferase n=1 Tax=Aquatica leii TaxID=1421715 RepID=A0AAN7P4F1_9COLE|nr:hypothetical protein RN001_011650 [Aquatica leii]